MPSVNITIVTQNRLNLTKICVDTLMPTIADKDVTVNIVDNGSIDGSITYLDGVAARFPQVRLWKLPRNMGVGVAANLGWAGTDADYYIKLDNDIEIVKADWLDRLLDFAVRNDDAVMVGYCFCSWHETIPVVLKDGTTILESLCCNGALVLIPRKVHAVCGFWNEDCGKYGHTDLDYSNRARIAGFYVGYLENDDVALHLGYERDIDEEREKEKFAVRTNDATGEKLYLLNKFLFDEGIRAVYVERRFLPNFSGKNIKFVVNPAYTNIIKLQQHLLEKVSYTKNGDMITFDFSNLRNMAK